MSDTRRNRRQRRSLVPKIVFAVIIVLIIAAAAFIYNRHSLTYDQMDLNTYYGLTSDNQAALVVNDTVLDVKGLVKNGKIYVDYDTVENNLNPGFFWEKDTQELLLTLPDGTQKWKPDDGSGAVLLDGDQVYISAECIAENSDIDMKTYENPWRVVARTKWTNLTAETVTEDDVIRYRGGPKADVLCSVKAGDTVVLTGNADEWCQVSTSDGFIGYILKSRLKTAADGTISHTTDSRFVFDHQMVDYKVNLAWQYCSAQDDGTGAFSELTRDAEGLNTISPTWFSFSGDDGTLTSYASADYVNMAHQAGLKVWGCLQDLSGSQVDIGDILMNQDSRTKAIDTLVQAAEDTQMDGINVDIETVTEENVPQYLQFLRELSVAAHEKNLVVSVDNYVPAYTTYLNRTEQAKTVDYLIIMGYDEHYAGSDEAGSVASLPFVKQGIEDTLAEVSADQVIDAIPFYTRGWTTVSGEKPSSEAFGMDEADEWVKSIGIQTSWDSKTGQYTGSVTDGDETYSIWLEDEKSIEEKMKLIAKENIAGVAAWRLGYERSDVWKIIEQYLNQ
ncbi:MAG: glycosyl hydrolase family 18 [Eubacterium sp.]|nr:glycosyl hydrolase family 18 [Eubacterium sp.]